MVFQINYLDKNTIFFRLLRIDVVKFVFDFVKTLSLRRFSKKKV